MTSDRIPHPDDQRLVDFADSIFSGRHASRGEIDEVLADLLRQLKREDRVPHFDASALADRKDRLMSIVTTTPNGTIPVAGIPITTFNGHISPPLPALSAPRVARHGLMVAVSLALLLVLLGSLGYTVFRHQSESERSIPAVIEGTPGAGMGLGLGADWAQFRGGVERTGYTTDPGPGGELNLIWTFTADEYLNPVMESDGKVIAYGASGGLYGVDALTGEQVWATDLSAETVGDPVRSSLPAIDGGKIFVSTMEGELVAVDLATGNVIWSQQLVEELPAPPMNPIVFDGVVYVVANSDQFLGLDVETGEQVWQATVPGSIGWRSAVIAEERIFIQDDAGSLHAFDLASGSLVWSTEPIPAYRGPAYGEGLIFIPGADGRTSAVSAEDGAIVWQTDPDPNGYDVLSLIVTDEALISIVQLGPVRALVPATGELLWSADVNIALEADPHAGGGTLYLQGMDSTFGAYSLEDGSFIAANGPYMAIGSTAAISGNMLFLSGLGGTIRAFGPVASTTQEVIASPPAERTPESSEAGSPISATPGAA